MAAERADEAQAHAEMVAEGQAEVRANARPIPTKPTREEVEYHNPTHVVFRNWFRCFVDMRARGVTSPTRQVRGRHSESDDGLDVFTWDDDVGFLIVSAAVTAIQATKHDDPRTVQDVVAMLET